ncbi:MAG: 8-oxo-dGTP diphosphatase [Bacteroidales bacterium]|nr:8-oxo-dGTP diphosphatase [Candidatus Colimorpha onthohippi]
MKQTTLCYIDSGTHYLMLHRTKKANDASHDKWIGVGGKFEPGEDAEQCMLREVNEETGLIPTQWIYCGVVDFESDLWPAEVMHLYRITQWNGTLRECDEGDIQWIPKTKVLSLPTWEGDRLFLTKILQESPFFHLRLVYHGDNLVESTEVVNVD